MRILTIMHACVYQVVCKLFLKPNRLNLGPSLGCVILGKCIICPRKFGFPVSCFSGDLFGLCAKLSWNLTWILGYKAHICQACELLWGTGDWQKFVTARIFRSSFM